jgi:hypothetical protein
MAGRLLIIDPGIYKTSSTSGVKGLQFLGWQDFDHLAKVKKYCQDREIKLLHSGSRKPDYDSQHERAFNDDFDLTNIKSKCNTEGTEIVAITRQPQSLDFFNGLQTALKDVDQKTKLTLANFGSGIATLSIRSATISNPKALTVGEFLAKQIPVDPVTPDAESSALDERNRLVSEHINPITTNIPECRAEDLTAWIDKAFGIEV